MPFGEAVQHFSLLTDRRRPGRADPGAADLGRDRHHRHARGLGGRPRLATSPARSSSSARPRWSPASSSARFALVPGLPKMPFLVVGALFFMVGADAARRADAGGRRRRRIGRPSSRPRCPRPPAAARPGPRGAADRPARAGDRLRPRRRWSTSSAGGSLLQRVSAVRRQIAGELGTIIPSVRIHDEVGLASHEYVAEGARHRGRPRPGHGRPPARARPGRRRRPARRHPDHRAGLRPAGGVDRRRGARRGRGAGLHRRRPRVGHRHPPHRDDPPPRRRPAHPPGRARAARRPQGAQRRGRRRGRARPALASARCSACCRRCCARACRSATSARSSRRSATAPASPATRRCSAEYAARRSAARSSPRTSTRSRACAPSRWTRRSSRRSPTRSPRRADGEYLAMDPQRAQALVVRPVRAVRAGRSSRGRRPVLLCSSRVRRHLRRLCEQALPQRLGLRVQRDRAGHRRGDRWASSRETMPTSRAGRRVARSGQVAGRRPCDDPACRALAVVPEGAPRPGRRLRGRLRQAG